MAKIQGVTVRSPFSSYLSPIQRLDGLVCRISLYKENKCKSFAFPGLFIFYYSNSVKTNKTNEIQLTLTVKFALYKNDEESQRSEEIELELIKYSLFQEKEIK